MIADLFIVLLISLVRNKIVNAVAGPWSFQQELRIPEGGISYGKSPVVVNGRGFVTLISGNASNGVYIHTTDNGHVDGSLWVWSQQARLIASDMKSGDKFGNWIAYVDQTLLISAPYSSSPKALHTGAVYVFNGTLRHWSQIQKLIPDDGYANDNFGMRLRVSFFNII